MAYELRKDLIGFHRLRVPVWKIPPSEVSAATINLTDSVNGPDKLLDINH